MNRLAIRLAPQRLAESKYSDPIPYTSLKEIFLRIAPIIHSSEESASIYYYAKADLVMRLNQITFHKELFNQIFQDRNVYVIDAEAQMLEDWEDWEETFLSINDQNAVIVISGCDFLLREERRDILHFLDTYKTSHLSQTLLFFFSIDFTSEPHKKLLQPLSAFSQNTIYIPLHSHATTLHFIDHMCALWNINMQQTDKELIANFCGGNFYFVKQAIRYFREYKKISAQELLEDSGMNQKLELVWNTFTEPQQALFKQVSQKREITELSQKEALQFLRSIGWFEGETCTAPIILTYAGLFLDKYEIMLRDDQFWIHNIAISHEFSVIERMILKLFLTHPQNLITREMLGTCVWGENPEKYSEWAIDQHISRLRKKLKRLNITSKIQTRKGKGYIYG